MKYDYPNIGKAVGELVGEKQDAYGDSFGKSGELLKILFPKGIPVDMYSDALAIVRIIDKLFRLCTDPDYGGESPWRDICGYSLLRLAEKEAVKGNPLKTGNELHENIQLMVCKAFNNKYIEDDCYVNNDDLTPDDTPPA